MTKDEFRGRATRFDTMDKNHSGKFDRDEIEKLHKSRMADPLSMRQRLESGQTRQPPACVRPPGLGAGCANRPTPPAGAADANATAGPITGEPFAVAPNDR